MTRTQPALGRFGEKPEARRGLGQAGSRVAVGTLSFILVAAGLALTAPAANAAPVSALIDGISYEADDSNVAAGATVVDYDPASGLDVVIPSSVSIGGEAYTVTAIRGDSFDGNGLTSVGLPNTIHTIGSYAFAENALTEIVIPDSVITIEGEAFWENSLGSVSIPSSVVEIGANAFDRNLLTSVSFSEGLTRLGNAAFARNLLTSVALPDSLTFIHDNAFNGNSLTSVTFGSGLQAIGLRAFESNSLTSITLPASLASVGPRAFGTNPLVSVTFLGNAPLVSTVGADGSFGLGAGTTLYFSSTASGFSTPSWFGYRTEVIAVVVPVTFTVSFDTAGGSSIGDVTVDDGGTVAQPAAPTRDGFTFTGWFTDAGATSAFDFATPITAYVTLYAGWAAVSTTPPAGGSQPAAPTKKTELAATGFGLGQEVLPLAALLLIAGAAALALRRREAHA